MAGKINISDEKFGRQDMNRLVWFLIHYTQHGRWYIEWWVKRAVRQKITSRQLAALM